MNIIKIVLPISDVHTVIYLSTPAHNQDMRHILLCEDFVIILQTATKFVATTKYTYYIYL